MVEDRTTERTNNLANRKIGITETSLAMPFDDMLPLAKELGIAGLQIWGVGGIHDAMALSIDDRKRLLDQIKSHGLEISALCAEVGGFTNPETVEDHLTRARAVVDMAVDMGVHVISGHVGVISEDPNDPGRVCMAKAMIEFGKYAEDRGKVYASETGPESIELMREFIDALPNNAIKLNYDPANLVMNGFNPVKGVLVGGDLIVHTHVKDGVRYDGRPLRRGARRQGAGARSASISRRSTRSATMDTSQSSARPGTIGVADVKGAIEVIKSL